jgi:HNH endonuclease
MKPGPKPRLPEVRMWKYIEKTDTCWLWTGKKDRAGYGVIGVEKGRFLRAPRVAYAHLVGPIPEGLFVLHHCDIPACVNPAHLYAGTRADNARDAIERKRLAPSSKTAHPGEENGRAKLTEEQVVSIRQRHADGESAKSLRAEFKISQAAMHLLLIGKNWPSVGGPLRIPHRARGSEVYMAKITEGDATAIRERAKAREPYAQIAVDYNMKPGSVGKIARRDTWKHVE